jgi:hypothetical protein
MTFQPSRAVVRGVLGSAVVLALAAPAAAYAGGIKHSDPAKDVQKITSRGSHTTITDAPKQTSADIVHFTAGYTGHRLKETIRLRGLAKLWSVTSRIKTPSTHFDVDVTRQAGTTSASLTSAGGTLVTCPGLAPAIDRAKHVVSVAVPSDCLNAPTWVQVGAGIVVLPKAGGTFYADDALRQGGVREKNLTLSRRLKK